MNEFDTLEASTPFSIGPRACIGRNLAYMEMRLVLAKMVWRFDLELMNEGENGMRRSWEESLRVAAVWIRPDLWVRYTERNEL